MAKIDKLLTALEATRSEQLKESGCMNTGDTVTVGYFELGYLLTYVTEQRANLVILERITDEAKKLYVG